MSKAQARELDKVKLGPAPARPTNDEEEDGHRTEDEVESDPSDIGSDVDPVYEVDAITWAQYRDSRFDREDGFKGWHYHVMWRGYLKSGSDTEEPRGMFDVNEDGKATALLEFWKSVEGKKVRKGKDEPGGRMGEVCHASEELLRRKFKEAKPKRSYEAYMRRIKAEREGFPILKRDSDYYLRKKRVAAKEAAKAAAAAAAAAGDAQPEAGPSTAPAVPARTKSKSKSRTVSEEPLSQRRGSAEPLSRKRQRQRDNSVEAMPPPTTTPGRPSQTPQEPESPVAGPSSYRPSPAPSFNSLFDEASQPSLSQRSAPPTPVKKGKADKRSVSRQGSAEKATKRRRIIDSASPPPSTDKGKGRADEPPSKDEKAKATSKVLSGIGKIRKRVVPADDDEVMVVDDSMPPPPARTEGPTFELDPNIFGDTAEASTPRPVPAVHRRGTPLFDFGDAGDTPASMAADTPASIQVEAPTPVKHENPDPQPRTFRSDDPDEEVEYLDVPQPQSPISVPDSEDEVAEVVGADTEGSAERRAAAEAEESAVNGTTGQQPDVVAIGSSPEPEFIPVPGSPPRASPPRQASPPPPAAREPEPAQAGPSNRKHAPLVIALPPSPPRDYRTAPPPSVSATPQQPPPSQQPQQTAPQPSLPPRAETSAAPPPTSAALPPPTSAAPPPIMPTPAAPPNGASAPATEPPAAGPSRVPASAPTGPAKLAKVNISDRPKYVQPKKIKTLDIPVDPDRDPTVRHLPADGRPPTISPVIRSGQLSPQAPPAPALPTVPPPQAPPTIPTQRRKWNAQPQPPPPVRPPHANGDLRRPSGTRPPGGVSPHGYGTSPYGHAGGVSPYGTYGTSPYVPRGGVSPYRPGAASPMYNGGVSPMNGGGMSPNGPAQASAGGVSPPWVPNAPAQASAGMSPQWEANAVQRQVQPPHQAQVAPVPEGTYEPRRDPRRDPRLRARAAPPAFAPPPPPSAPGPPTVSQANATPAVPQRSFADASPLCTIQGFADSSKNAHPESLVKLSLRNGWSSDASYRMEKSLNANHKYVFDPVDRRSLQMTLREGARIVEWALVTPESTPGESAKLWKVWHSQLNEQKILVCADEIQPQGEPVTAHNILIIARGVDSRIAQDADVNGWNLEQLDFVAVLLEVPLAPTVELPDLPNPVRPFAKKQATPPVSDQPAHNTVASYGFDDEAVSRMKRNAALYVLPATYLLCNIYGEVVQQAERSKLQAPQRDVSPDVLLILNGAFQAVLRSGTFRRSLDRNTRYYSLGHDLMSMRPQWQLRPVWETGGLVTFSPSFLLGNFDIFTSIMKIIRTAPNWAAYIIPESMLFFEQKYRIKSTDPARAFATFSSALFLDDDHHRQAGTMSTDTSGLVISCSPPPLPLRESCKEWHEWLARVFKCTDYDELLELCREWKAYQSSMPSDADLVLADVEKAAFRDLAAMRRLPHCVPYRRCIMVGSLSRLEELRSAAESNSIDLISAEQFEATFAGAV